MNSEVCPFCGKAFKRLKSHLPHCKASKRLKTPPANQDATENQASDSPPASALSRSTPKGRMPTQMPSVATHLQSERIKEVSSSESADVFSISSRGSSGSAPPQMKKQADHIKSSAPPQSFTASKPKKKSLRELIEAAKVEHFTKGSIEEAKSPSKKSSVSAKTKSIKAEDSMKGVSVALESTERKPKSVSKKKKSAPHKADILSSFMKENRMESKARDKFWMDGDGEMEDVSEMLLKPRNGHQVKVTLLDMKAALGRGDSRREPSKILRNTDAADNQRSDKRLDSDLNMAPLHPKNQEDVESLTRIKPLNLVLTESKQTAVIPLKEAPQQLQTFLATQQAPPSLLTASLNEAQRFHHLPDLLSILHPISSPLLYPPAARSLCGRVEELQLKVWKQDAAEKQAKGAVTQRTLGQVRLRELPEWLASRTPTHPRDVIEMVQKGWQWYHSKYIDVKKGGVAGVGMLLVGYCVLSYIWSYPHIKLSRWRKYH
ncbi:hypothetical protein OJAV_G00192460 [Oryzias javanicus]|uniref:Uncharacterized protein n=1 Tax=Oryzias javanicus TaxID=123683 RepID=A0A3S2MI19_ORYJA|nr:hypothetical protein OJAV_G00192460 [Oryzias javanicus]